MKFFALISLLSVCCSALYAQQDTARASNDLRDVLQEARLTNSRTVFQLLEWNDSLQTDRNRWSLPYDSLITDSVALTPFERNLVRMDAALLNYEAAPSPALYAQLKTCFSSMNEAPRGVESYTRELQGVLLEMAIDAGDYPFAYAMQNKLHAANFSDWKTQESILQLREDSLRMELASLQSKSAVDLQKMSETAVQWHLIAMAALIVLFVLIVVFIVIKRRWNAQKSRLSARVEDTSEEEALVHKLEEARIQIQELKLLAKKRLEVPVATALSKDEPIQHAPSAQEIAEWNDQIQQSLARIKTHCESGKASMGVPTYMSIVNDVTRLSAQVSKKSEQWMDSIAVK